MCFQFIALFAIIASVSAGIIPAAQLYHANPHSSLVSSPPVYAAVPAAVSLAHAPVALAHKQTVLAKHDDEYDPHPQYKYGYNVEDVLSGDSKSQFEERDGDVVHGEYSLVDSDGFKRIVQYTSDSVNGFNAVVNRVPLEHVKNVVPIAVASVPSTFLKASPIAYHEHH